MRALLLVALAACGDTDIGEDAMRFADLDDGTITRVVFAASGGDVTAAVNHVFFMTQRASDCPRIDVAGETTTITGGCTSGDQIFDGVVRITKTVDDEQYVFERFSVTERSGPRVAYDGEAHRILTPATRVDAEMFVGRGTQLVKSTLEERCDATTCTVEGFIELFDGGIAQASGERSRDRWGDGRYTVRAAGRLDVDLVPGAFEPCLFWTLAGTERTGGTFCDR
jgi:hypothetical protein